MAGIKQQKLIANIVIVIGFLLQIGHASAQEGEWRVRKTSGDAWVGQSQAQQVSLSDAATLKPGDSIRTGRTGRVLLSRGEETILVSPNSAITLPPRQEGGMRTVIIQQAGNILIQAEKRDVRHFQVETPYLAAVVKGTRFNVSVNGRGANVNVMQGRVEVSDFKTGQIAMVLPGQTANVLSSGTSGLKLSGSGTFNPIAQGTPRTTPVRPVPVPRDGFQGPAPQAGRQARVPSDPALIGSRQTAVQQRLATTGASQASTPQMIQRGPNNSLRITAPLGEVKVNINKASAGLANATLPVVDQRGNAREKTIWNANSTGEASGTSTPTLLTSNRGNGNANSNSASSNSGSAGSSAANSAVSSSSGSGVSSATNAVAGTVSSTVATTTSVSVNAVNSLTSGNSGNSGSGSVESENSGKSNALTKGNGLKLGLTK